MSREGAGHFGNTLAALLWVSCASGNAVNRYEDIQKSFFESLESKLTVNTSERHYWIEMSREKGESYLSALGSTSPIEEAFAFARFSDGTERWYEIGEEETGTGCSFVPARLLNDVRIAEVEELSFYHFHPQQSGQLYHYGSEAVSPKDLMNSERVMKIILNEYPDLSDKTDFRVVVSSGTYAVKFNRNNYERMVHDGEFMDKIKKQLLDMWSHGANPGHKEPEYDFRENNRRNFPAICMQFANDYSNEVYSITFMPH